MPDLERGIAARVQVQRADGRVPVESAVSRTARPRRVEQQRRNRVRAVRALEQRLDDLLEIHGADLTGVVVGQEREHLGQAQEIGRASCRGRGCQYVSISVVAVSLKKKR